MSVTVMTLLDVVPPPVRQDKRCKGFDQLIATLTRIVNPSINLPRLPVRRQSPSPALTYNASMHHTNPAPDTTLSDDDVRACVRVLRAIQADRSHLTRLTQDQRRELLQAGALVVPGAL